SLPRPPWKASASRPRCSSPTSRARWSCWPTETPRTPGSFWTCPGAHDGGGPTHLAARMEQAALPGTILTTGDTLRLAEGYVRAMPLGPVAVKGLTAPISVYEVTGSSVVATRLHAAAARGLTPFVGRDPETEQLRHALEKVRQGHGQVVAVVGEPGV